MKNKVINLLGLGIFSCFLLVGSAMPVNATDNIPSVIEESDTTTESPVQQKEPSVLKIEAYNNTSKKYESSVTFMVTNRATGQLISFSKDSNGNYVVDENGFYKYLEPINGYVNIIGLNGSYTVAYSGNNSELYCASDKNHFQITDDEEKSIRFEYVQNYGSLNITLLSEDESAIADAKFVLKNSSGSLVYFKIEEGVYIYQLSGAVSEITTNAAGKIMIAQLPAGTYTIEQTSAPIVYNGDMVVKSIVVENQKQVTISLTNTKDYGDLVVTVFDESDTSKTLSGSVYYIKDMDGNYIYVSKVSDGEYTFSRTNTETTVEVVNGSFKIVGLPKGSYILSEKTPPTGYNTIGTKDFDIQRNNTTNISIKNERALGSLSILIIDEETEEPIKGFTYQVIMAETEEPIGFKETLTGYSFNINGETEVVTDASGKIYLSNIPTGTYYLRQVGAAKGYLLDLDDIEQIIDANTESVYETIASKSNSAIVIVNTNGDSVAGVLFEVQDEDGNVILSDITNENGKYLISGISAGKYTLLITGVPETYGPYNKTISFSIDETGLSEGLGKITIDYNKVVLNIGKAGINVCLTNNNDQTSTIITTDENGIVEFTKLEYADYTITLEDENIQFDAIDFVVDEDFENLSYNVEIMENENIETPEPAPTKKVNGNVIILIIAVLVAIASGVLLFFKKKKKNNTSDNIVRVGYDEDGNAVIFEEIEVDAPADDSIQNNTEDVEEIPEEFLNEDKANIR